MRCIVLNTTQSAYEYCKAIIDKHSKTFSKAFALLPKKQKQAVWAIYAFCRQVDDIVDEGQNPSKELKEFEQEFHYFLAGHLPSDDPMWLALQDVFQRFNMDTVPFQEMIDGQRLDIDSHIVQTEDELMSYCYLVASTVGLMLLPVIAPGKEEKLREGAIHLGKGMQLTNILRDIGEDMERNRVYIPEEVMVKYDYGYDELYNQTINSSFIQLWEDLAHKAQKHYELALETIHEYPLYSRTPVKGAAYLYKAILPAIRENNYQVFSERNYVSDRQKKEILANMNMIKA